MALNEILSKIEDDTRREEEKIISDANKKAEDIINEAKKKSEAIFEEYNKKAKEDAEAIKREKISSLTMEERNLLEKEIEKIEKKYEESLKIEIENFKKTSEYQNFLEKAIESSWKRLGPGSIVYVNPADSEKIRNISIPVTIIPKEIDSIGGVIVTSGDGKLLINSTLSEIINEKKEKILKIARSYIR